MCAKIAQNHETKEQKGENSQSAGLPLFVAPLKMNNGEQLSMMNNKLFRTFAKIFRTRDDGKETTCTQETVRGRGARTAEAS